MRWIDEVRAAGGLQAALVAHGPRLATILLAGLLAIQAGFLVTSQNRGSPLTTSAGPAPELSPPTPPLQLATIASAHLFGEAQNASVDANAPQTSVQLLLSGVLAVPDPKRGLAIIGPTAAAGRLYSVGSALPGGVSLYAVYPDRVLINRGGVIESLQLPKQLQPAAAPALANVGQSPAQRLAALAQGNGALLGGLVRATPVLDKGKLSGYRIYPGGRASLNSFTQLGLRPGDLITAVNGTQLDDPGRGSEILQTLSSSANANVTIQRNGQSMDLNLNLETVVNDAETAAAQAAAAQAAGAAAAATERRGGAFGPPFMGGGRLPGLRGSIGAPATAPGTGDEASAPTQPVPEPPSEAPDDQ
jgi:general secretion pathway protein C